MCWNCSNTTERHLLQWFPVKTGCSLQSSGWCEPVNPAETLCVIFGYKNKLQNISLARLSSAVPLPADDVMADVTSSPDYGSALLAAPSEPADADSLAQITLRWQEEIDCLPFSSALWFYSIVFLFSLLALLIKCLRTHEYFQPLQTHFLTVRRLYYNERQQELSTTLCVYCMCVLTHAQQSRCLWTIIVIGVFSCSVLFRFIWAPRS